MVYSEQQILAISQELKKRLSNKLATEYELLLTLLLLEKEGRISINHIASILISVLGNKKLAKKLIKAHKEQLNSQTIDEILELVV